MAGRDDRAGAGPAGGRERRGGQPRDRSPAARPFTIRDQVALQRLAGFAVSPDGSRVILKIAAAARGGSRLDTRLWVIGSDGTGLRRLPGTGRRASNPVWAPDGGSVYLLDAARSGDRRIVRVSPDSGDPQPVAVAPVDIESFTLSRDGTLLAFSAMVDPGCGPGSLAATEARRKKDSARPSTGRIHDRLFVRHWDEWKDGRRRHLFVQPVAGGPAIDVMPDMDADAPSKPFGGSEQYTFTPDGRGLVFTARDAGPEEAWSTDLDLFLVPMDGGAPPRKLTTQNRASDTDPTFSPDGRRLAWLAMDRPGFEADKQTVMVRDWPEGAPRRLTDHWDRSVECLAWSADGGILYATAQDTGQRGLFAIDVASGSVEPLEREGHVLLPATAGKAIYYLKSSLAGPADLHAREGGRERRITRLNEAALRGIVLGEAEQFSFAGWNGETVHGYLVRPAMFDPARRYPVAFIVHGGPQGSMGNDWGWRWNPQVYAGAGYAVVMIDFHGSTGYGRAFTDSITGDWGGKPLDDLRKGYDYALGHYPFLDPARAAALGASFGGFMVNLMAGVWNEPWRCLVSHDGNFDERFAYFATDELWFPEWEHGGTPWANPAGYERDNPVNHIASWRVPMLIIHGALDYRVTDVEGMAVFTALQRRGIPSRFLHFPDENHWVQKPANSVLWYDTVLEWLDRWTAAPAVAPDDRLAAAAPARGGQAE